MNMTLASTVLDILNLLSSEPELAVLIVAMGIPWMAGFFLLYRITKRILHQEGHESSGILEVEQQLITLTSSALEQVTVANREVVITLQALSESLHQHDARSQEQFSIHKSLTEAAVTNLTVASKNRDRQLKELATMVVTAAEQEKKLLEDITTLLSNIKEYSEKEYEVVCNSLLSELSERFESLEATLKNSP